MTETTPEAPWKAHPAYADVPPQTARQLVDALTAAAAEIDRDPQTPLIVLVGRTTTGAPMTPSGRGDAGDEYFCLFTPGCWPDDAGKYIAPGAHKYNEAPLWVVDCSGPLIRALDGLDAGDVVAVLATRAPEYLSEEVHWRTVALAVAREEAPPCHWRTVGGVAVLSDRAPTVEAE